MARQLPTRSGEGSPRKEMQSDERETNYDHLFDSAVTRAERQKSQEIDPENDNTWDNFIVVRGQDVGAALRQLIVEYYGYVAQKISGYYQSARMPYRSLLDQSDLHSYATIGLIEAVDAYFPDRGAKFETFATPRIRGAIIDGLRNLQDSTRRISRIKRELGPFIEILTQELGRVPLPEELAERFPHNFIGDEYLCDVVHDPLVWSSVFNQRVNESASGGGGGDDELVVGDDITFEMDGAMMRHRGNTPIRPDDRACRMDTIDKILRILSDDPQEKAVIFNYYFCGLTTGRIAEIMKLSPTWVSTKKISGEQKLRQYAMKDRSFRFEFLP